ncbi:dihydropteroate synthase [Curvivirga aplysinae]|uniref:dihydropteroate synthase n=1 Tax=Curvivirga aplysinae TaxID=2529852 RepID=UPI0012BC7BD3|nr:dihydropteroate synthase [Curvivirga aplysinae]MTI10435.1 dihydropteroate synthase [Curvivirga aplysinae]
MAFHDLFNSGDNNQEFQLGDRCLVMGIMNVTPDSFSGDGLRSKDVDLDTKVLKQAEFFLSNGADILDIGGESTRPGAEIVGEHEELKRVEPAIKAIVNAFPNAVLSVDTYKAAVAEAALNAGAHIINDVWGFKADPDMSKVAVKHQAPVILMHNRSKPGHAEIDARLGGAYIAPKYNDFLNEVIQEMRLLIEGAITAGVKPENIMIDPGVGFGKTAAQNMELINRLDVIKEALGYPILLGSSRKSFIGLTLDVPADERVEGTAATVSLGVARGADVVRVHDVKVMDRIVRMTDAMLRAG